MKINICPTCLGSLIIPVGLPELEKMNERKSDLRFEGLRIESSVYVLPNIKNDKILIEWNHY